MSVNEMICVVCPIGCRLTVSVEESVYTVEGNQCKRGEGYAVDELTHPTRTVTSTVKIESLQVTRLPVKTQQAFPKGKMLELMAVLKKVVVKPPVQRGQVIVENALGTGINLVSTRTIN